MSDGIVAIELALRNDFVKTFRKIAKIVREEEAEKYLRIFLHRWDVQNIKTILRGKNIHTTNEEILSCLVPVGELDEVALTELLKQSSVKSLKVIHMEVPCCSGLVHMAKLAIQQSGKDIPMEEVTIGIKGEILLTA